MNLLEFTKHCDIASLQVQSTRFTLKKNHLKNHSRITFTHFSKNKTKVLSVQLGKTLSSVKFAVEWGGVGWVGTLDCSSLTLKRPTYQILASCYA